MATSLKFARFALLNSSGTSAVISTIRYWLFWVSLLTVLAIGINAYFDYRNRELDKRLEQINMGYRQSNL